MKKKFLSRLFIIFAYFFVCNSIFAIESKQIQALRVDEYQQWFMGPILTPNPTTVPPNHPGLELDLIFSKTYGLYDSNSNIKTIPSIYSIRPLFDLQVGFNEVIGAEIIGSVESNFCEGESSTHLADTIFRLGFQVCNDELNTWIPDFRVLLQETFPTGNYKKFDPHKKGTDSTGQGSFQTGIQLVFQKAFNSNSPHPFRIRGCIGYFIPSSVDLEGINYYGGYSETNGVANLGNYYVGFLYAEYALSRRWAIACELSYINGNSGHFKGSEKVNLPSYSQLSVLPEIQHTFSENLGIILGGWFTVTGRNSAAFGKVLGAVLILF